MPIHPKNGPVLVTFQATQTPGGETNVALLSRSFCHVWISDAGAPS